MRVVLSLVLVLALCLTAVGCAGKIKKSDAKETAEAFLAAVAEGDFEAAETYLHPRASFNAEEIFSGIESRVSIDFQKGIEIRRYTDFSSSLYDDDVKGSDYELEMDILVDGVTLELSIEIVKNDHGYGIYEIDFDR